MNNTPFDSTNNILYLMPSGTGGCVPNKGAENAPPWTPKKNSLFAIVNLSGAQQVLVEITPNIIKQQDPQQYPLDNDNSTQPATKKLTIVANGVWIGRAGNAGQGGSDPATGSFIYNDGLPGSGMRTGTINPN